MSSPTANPPPPENTHLSYPPQLTQQELESLIDITKDWTAANGLCIRPPFTLVPQDTDPSGVLATSAPVTLFPSRFPMSCWNQGRLVQKAYNELYARISQDEIFIEQVVNDVIEGDDFIAHLWAVHQKVKKEGYTHKYSLGLFRSDYMIHQDVASDAPHPQIKQVEFNTIASSFGGLSVQTANLHRYLSKTAYPLLTSPLLINQPNLPPNLAIEKLAQGLAEAHSLYEPTTTHPLCILFIVQPGERNIFDQRHLEYHLQTLTLPTAPIFRLSIPQILQQTSIPPSNTHNPLLYTLPTNPSKIFEVSTIYLRAGYGPADHASPSAWDARYHLERSAAIKCPTVLTQLAGAKKVQQVIATPGALSQFLSSSGFTEEGEKAENLEKRLHETFTNIYPLDDSLAGLKARVLAFDPKECENYVLKPQREGGGNNIYRSAIPAFLKSLPETHWKSYILMELITPPEARNMILRNGVVEEGGVIGELGVYGTCVWESGKGGKVVHNEEAGYLLRTKGDKSEEGGVAAGYGCMDSVLLV